MYFLEHLPPAADTLPPQSLRISWEQPHSFKKSHVPCAERFQQLVSNILLNLKVSSDAVAGKKLDSHSPSLQPCIQYSVRRSRATSGTLTSSLFSSYLQRQVPRPTSDTPLLLNFPHHQIHSPVPVCPTSARTSCCGRESKLATRNPSTAIP